MESHKEEFNGKSVESWHSRRRAHVVSTPGAYAAPKRARKGASSAMSCCLSIDGMHALDFEDCAVVWPPSMAVCPYLPEPGRTRRARCELPRRGLLPNHPTPFLDLRRWSLGVLPARQAYSTMSPMTVRLIHPLMHRQRRFRRPALPARLPSEPGPNMKKVSASIRASSTAERRAAPMAGDSRSTRPRCPATPVRVAHLFIHGNFLRVNTDLRRHPCGGRIHRVVRQASSLPVGFRAGQRHEC